METLGIQLLAELGGCAPDLLDDEQQLKSLLGAGLKKCGLVELSRTSHKFEPIGVTVISIINESHVAIHTYPETLHASIDIFHCSDDAQPMFDLLDYLTNRLQAQSCKVMNVARGNRLKVVEIASISSRAA